MGLQREVSPIPAGRYWLLITGGTAMADFNAWLRDMHGAAQVEHSSLDQSTSPPNEFVIFRVPEGRMPFLNAAEFGYPSFAGPEVASRQDVIHNELHMNPEDVAVEVIRKAGDSAETLAAGFPIALLVLAVALGGSAFSHR
jgi:hypothetical protein